MRLISCHGGVLRTRQIQMLGLGGTPADASDLPHDAPQEPRGVITGLTALDGIAPGGAFARGAVHELLWPKGEARPFSPALILARAAIVGATPASPVAWTPMSFRTTGEASLAPTNVGCERRVESWRPGDAGVAPTTMTGAVVWCDPRGEIYPPALAAMGVPLERLYLLRPKNDADAVWAVAECLAARGVRAVVMQADRLSRVQARKLQLAAERGGGIGLLLRPEKSAIHYAAVTRWRVTSVPGEPGIQRWRLELLHGHGGQIGSHVILEICRDPFRPNHVSAFTPVADRPAETSANRVA